MKSFRDLETHNRLNHAALYVNQRLDGYSTLRKECIYGQIDFQHELEFQFAAKKQIAIYQNAASAEVTLMVNDEDVWDDWLMEGHWIPARRFITSNSKTKDPRIWKLFNEQEQNLYNEFLDMWGTWRKNNSTVTYLKITREPRSNRNADYKYTKHDINDCMNDWDKFEKLFNGKRTLKCVLSEEELREDIPIYLKSVNTLIEQFRSEEFCSDFCPKCQ